MYHELMWQWLKKQVDIIVLLFCMLLTLVIWHYWVENDNTVSSRLEQISRKVANELVANIDHLKINGLALAGFYEASEIVSNEELSSFVKKMIEPEKYPVILRLSYVERIKATKEKSEQYIVRQVVDRWGNYYPATNQDLMSEPQRRTLVQEAVESRKTVYGWVDKIVNVAEYDGSGILIMTPLIRNDEVVGIVNLVLSTEQLEIQIAELVGEGAAWEWWVNEKSVAKGGNRGEADAFTRTKVELGSGVVWGVDIYIPKLPDLYSNWILLVGVMFSFLLYAVVYALTSASVRAEHLAKVMTAELAKYKLALDSTSTHIIITDMDGKILYANPAAVRLTGYSIEEMKGNTPRLWGKQMDTELYKKLWQTIKVEKKVFVGEIWNKNKSGKKYLAAATIAPIINDENQLIGFVGIEEDITEQKAASDEMRRLNELMVGRELKMVELKKQLEQYAKK